MKGMEGMRKIWLMMALIWPTLSVAQKEISTHAVDWASFLKQHDLEWDTITADYYSGAIMGNGLIGNSIYKHEGAYKFHIGRVDITEGRMPTDHLQYHNLYDGARMPIGFFTLRPHSKVVSDQMRLNLWDAETTGQITTEKGKIKFRSYVHATKNIIVLECNTIGSKEGFDWLWHPLKAISPRAVFGSGDTPQKYLDSPNPDARQFSEDGYHFSIQTLLGGKTYVVAWVDQSSDDVRTIMMTISQSDREQEALLQARQELEKAIETDKNELVSQHRNWWHAYYPASFASFGDAQLESFYWIQQYKYACLTRPGLHIIDLQGPWAMEKTPWPAIWLNLNVQLTYSPLFTANRTDYSKPL